MKKLVDTNVDTVKTKSGVSNYMKITSNDTEEEKKLNINIGEEQEDASQKKQDNLIGGLEMRKSEINLPMTPVHANNEKQANNQQQEVSKMIQNLLSQEQIQE